MLKNIGFRYIFFLTAVLTVWGIHMFSNNLFGIIAEQWKVVVTMIFGAFIAGSSPEGSASIAYPVFTLLLDISTHDARNFAFAIQSIGMTSASLFILDKKMPVDWKYISYVSVSGILGLVLGTFYAVPFIAQVVAKISFVSLWLAFGIVLYLNHKKQHAAYKTSIGPLSHLDKSLLICLGILGGGISAIFGTGINILTFCFMVIYHSLHEKVATPSSIIIMTIETIVGFLLHALWLQDFSEQSNQMWLASIPVVVFFAPLGTWVMSKVSYGAYKNFLYVIFMVQYLGAIWAIKPDLQLISLSALIIVLGIVFFRLVSLRNPEKSS
jgi:uncharacterized membrane protein YfcA